MVSVAMIIVAIVGFFLLLAANVYIIVYFQHEEDKNTAWWPKIVVMVGLLLTEINVLMLPMDVSNRDLIGGFPMEILWQVVLLWIAIWAIVIMPFTFFYYEAYSPGVSNTAQIREAACWGCGLLIIFTIALLTCYFTLGTAQIPVVRLEAKVQPYTPALVNSSTATNNGTNATAPVPAVATLAMANAIFDCGEGAGACDAQPNYTIDFQVSFALYLISMMTLVGMVTFVCFGGIGLAALPMDLINAFRTRRPQMSLKEYSQAKVTLGKRATRLLEEGTKLQTKLKSRPNQRPKTRKEKTLFRRFRTAVFQLEEDFITIEKSYNGGVALKALQIFWPHIQLVLGILGILVTIAWLLHVFLFLVPQPPVTPFLNSFFIVLDGAFSLLGTLAYGLFTFYMLWCVMKGNFKFGVRIPFIFEIYPVKMGGTLMNSFIFNVMLVMLASVAVTQFCSLAFSVYSRFTAINSLFNVGIKNLIFFGYFWQYYYWALIGVALIALILLLVFPSDKKDSEEALGLQQRQALP